MSKIQKIYSLFGYTVTTSMDIESVDHEYVRFTDGSWLNHATGQSHIIPDSVFSITRPGPVLESDQQTILRSVTFDRIPVNRVRLGSLPGVYVKILPHMATSVQVEIIGLEAERGRANDIRLQSANTEVNIDGGALYAYGQALTGKVLPMAEVQRALREKAPLQVIIRMPADALLMASGAWNDLRVLGPLSGVSLQSFSPGQVTFDQLVDGGNLTNSGTGSITVLDAQVNTMFIRNDSTGTVRINKANCKDLVVRSFGPGDVTLKGKYASGDISTFNGNVVVEYVHQKPNTVILGQGSVLVSNWQVVTN